MFLGSFVWGWAKFGVANIINNVICAAVLFCSHIIGTNSTRASARLSSSVPTINDTYLGFYLCAALFHRGYTQIGNW